MQLLASGKTHAGRRTSNEDCFGIELELGLFVVADGMGAAGDAASRLAVDTICQHFRAAGRGDPLIEFDAAIATAAQRIHSDRRRLWRGFDGLRLHRRLEHRDRSRGGLLPREGLGGQRYR